MNFANQFGLPYGYYGKEFQPGPRDDLLQGSSDIPQYQEAISFWNEAGASARKQALQGVETTKRQRERATRNQQMFDQRAVDGPLNRGGFIVEDSLPMSFESKLELYAQFYGGAVPGMETWIPEKDRQDIIQMRIQSLEEQDQVAELNDPTVEEGASELEQIQDAQAKIDNILRLINAQLVGGLIDKSILASLSQIADILGEWGYAFGTSYLDTLRTQLLEEPGVADPDQLEAYRQKGAEEIAPEGQNALIVAISEFAKAIDRDIISRLLDDDYQSRNLEERKLALSSIMSAFQKKTYSQLSPKTVLPRTKQEAISKIMDVVDFYIGQGNYDILQVIDPAFNPANIDPETFVYDDRARQTIIAVLRREPKEFLIDLYSRIAGQGGMPPFGVPEFGEPVGQVIDVPGEVLEAPIESAEAVIPGQIEMLQPLELPGGEAESKEMEEEGAEAPDIATVRRAKREARRRIAESSGERPPLTLEEMMERRRRGETAPPPPRRRPRAPRRTPPRPASAAESAFGEELGERLAEESFLD